MKQTSKQEKWKDESKMEVPYKRISKAERLMEIKSHSLLTEAKGINSGLQDFKNRIKAICEEVYSAFMLENNVKSNSKGNFTWYNFDRTIKVEVAISEPVKFDDMAIQASKEKLDEFLESAVDSKIDFVKDLIKDAFSTSNGKLDAKRVLGLLRYKSRVTSPLFLEAMDLIEKGIRRPESKTYFRIWEKDTDGKYQAIELNFSNI